MSKNKKKLVIAPHPDDEVLGCGGTIKRYANEGKEVHVCFVTKTYSPDWSDDFREKRKEEIMKVKEILDIEGIYFLDFPTAKLDTIPQKEINDSLMEIVKKVMPDTLFLPWKGDPHRDHQEVFEAGLVASKLSFQKKKSPNKILSYETSSETEWGTPPDQFNPNLFVNITDTIEKKINALNFYKTETKEFPHPRSEKAVRALAQTRGSEVGVNYAESFYLIKKAS